MSNENQKRTQIYVMNVLLLNKILNKMKLTFSFCNLKYGFFYDKLLLVARSNRGEMKYIL